MDSSAGTKERGIKGAIWLYWTELLDALLATECPRFFFSGAEFTVLDDEMGSMSGP